MKKAIIAALAVSTALIATPAAAQNATGTVNITGTVTPKCQIVDGNGAPSSFTSNVNLGELSDSNGLLKSSGTLSSLFNAGGTGGSAMTFRVVCTTATPGVSLTASPITAGAAAPTGYANRVDYDATATFALTSGGPDAVTDDSAIAGATTGTLSARLAGSGNNVTITAANFRTPTATDILVADSYTGQVVVVISPGA